MSPSTNSTATALPKPLGTRRRIVIAVAVALTAGALALAATSRVTSAAPEPKPKEPTLAVTTVSPATTTFARGIPASGSIAPRDELVIGSDATGVRILDIPVEVGSVVRKGQLLMRADDAQLKAQYAQQDAVVREAEAGLAQAEANLDRAERLRDSGVYSVETVQTRRTSAASARAKHDLALAQRRELEVKIAQTRVVAPDDGVISKKSATQGAVVQAGQELFRLIRNGELEWLAELPDHAIARVRPGGKARIVLDDGRAIDATIRKIAPTVDAATRNGLVHVTLPADAMLKAGGHAKGEIVVDRAEGLALAETSVVMRDGYPFVFVVDDAGIAHLTRIETGTRQRGVVEITAGLAHDARVVGTGAGFVKDGDRVRVAHATRETIAQTARQQ